MSVHSGVMSGTNESSKQRQQIEPSNIGIASNLLDGYESNLLRHEISFRGHRIRVHMHALVTKSYYFYERYLQHDGSNEPLTIKETDNCCLDALEMLLFFCHFDRVKDMRISLIRETLLAAQKFECSSLLRYTESFIRANLSIQNICAIWRQLCDCTRLQVVHEARLFLLKNFLNASRQPDFREFSAEIVVDLLRDQRLNAWSEDVLVEPLLKWLENRLTPLWDQMCLLSALRFQLLSERSLQLLSRMDAFDYFSTFRTSKMFASMCRDSATPRLPDEYLLVLGGMQNDGSATSTAQLVDLRTGSSSACAPNLPEPRAAFACCCHDSILYVAGGWIGHGEETNTCLAMDLRPESNPENAWTPIANLHEARSSLSIVVCDSIVYVIGGESDTEGCFDTVEAFELDELLQEQQQQQQQPQHRQSKNLQQHRWNLKAPLPLARSAPGVACLKGAANSGGSRRSLIIVCGGFLQPGFDWPSRLVDVYSPADDQWTRISHGLQADRGSPCLLALNNSQSVLVLGGNDLASFEMLNFDPDGIRSAAAPAELHWLLLQSRAWMKADCRACLVDSRWLLASNNEELDGAEFSRNHTVAISIEELEQAAAASSEMIADQRGIDGGIISTRPADQVPQWISDFNLEISRVQFGLAAVPASARLFEGF